jgi:hypothetical protein
VAIFQLAKIEQHEFIGIGTAVFGGLDVDAAHAIARSFQVRDEVMANETACPCDQCPRLRCF